MADVQSNIQVNLDASQALAQLKELQRQLATFHSSVATTSSAAAKAQASLQSNLINSVNATGKFAASLTTIKSSADSFTDSLERNKFSTREYFRYAGGATKTFGRIFKQEFDTIGKVAEERVKTMQTQYIKMGRDANGAIKAIAVKPLALDMENLGTKTALAAQKQQLFNQLMKQGSTNLLNFGKNTQWAGRQLMVGFTVPLTMLGMTAGKTFMALEKQAIRFKRVYGEMFTTTAETERAFRDIELLAKSFTKYGVAVEKTLEMAADAAATGKVGADLMAQVAEATRLAVLGGVEQEKALETTISLTNAFGIAADELRQKIDFLNAVENQTILNIEDLTIAVPKAGPVIRQLGGDVEDLAFFMTAMKEGGINASEGANALKSGLASMINPSKKAAAFLQDLGINLNGIVEANKGNIKNTVVQFAQALDTLAPLERSRAIEQLFGKFQFARLSTLFQNITKDGSQAARTLNLAGASVQELAILSERELKKVEDATGTKFKKSIEDLKVSLMPVGKEFLKALTPVVEFIGKILEKFNGLSDGAKARITKFIAIIGIIGPAVLMTFGLVANGVANLLKLFVTLRKGFFGLGGQSKTLGQQIQYMSSEQIEAATVAASLNQAHSRLRQTFLLEAASLNTLTTAYQRGMVAANNFARTNPGMMKPGFRSGAPKKFADGGWVPGTGNKDTVPMILSKGSFVVNKGSTEENKGFLQRLNKGGLVLRGEGNPFDNVGVYDPDQLEAITPDMTPEQRKHTEQRNREIARRVRTTKVINKIDAIVEKTPIGEKHRAKQQQEEDRQKQEEDEIKRANQRAVDEVKDKETIQKAEKELIKTKNKIKKIDYQMAQAKKAGDTERLASLKRAKENAVYERKNAVQAMNSARETAKMNREMNSTLVPPVQTPKEAKRAAKEQRRERGRQIGQRAGGAMMGASMAMGALSMAPGKTGEVAQTLMPIVGLASMVAPMIGSPLGAVVAPLAAFGAAVIALNVIFDNAQAAALKLGETTGTSTKAINQYAIFANRVTKSEIQDRKRIEKASGLPIKPGKTTFGQAYVQTKEGQESIAAIGQTIINDKKGGREKATKDLSAQLITSVLSGALSSSEAQSIAANIGVQMKDHTIGMTVAAEIQGIFGKDGKDLLKEGVDLQVRLMSDSSKNLTSKNSNFDKLNQQSQKGLSAFGTKTNVGGMVAGGAALGAGIGAGIGSFIPVPVLGTAIGALVGTAIGGIVGGVGAYFANKSNTKKMGALSGAAIADAQGMFEQSKQLLDAHKEQYESKRQELILQNKIGEATKLQLKYEKERADLTAAANTQRQNFAKSYEGTKGTFRESLDKGYKKAIKSKYKGTADEAYVDAAITGMDDLKDKTFTRTDKKTGKQVTEKIMTEQERAILMGEGLAGTLSPQAQSAITNQMSGQYQADTIDVVKNFGGQVATQAIGVTNAMNEGPNKALNERNKQEFIYELKTKKTSKEAEDFTNLVEEFAQLNGPMKLDTEMEFFLKLPDEDKLKLANDLQKIKDTKNVKKIEFLSEVSIPKGAVDQKYLQGLTDEQAKVYLQTIKKTLVVDLVTTVNSPEFKAWLATTGKEHQGKDPGVQVQKYAEYMGYVKTEVVKATSTPPPKTPGSGGSAKRDDRFDDMLKKLKLFQQASVKATGGLKELERVMNAKPKSGGSAWMKFEGTLGQIRKLAKKKVGKKETALVGGKQVSAEYQDLIENLSPEELQDPKILKKYGLQTDKKGNITGLDEARVNVIEKGLVSGQTGQQVNDIVKNLQKQKNINEAVNKLRISGMRYEEAINFVSTEGIAIAINKGEFTKEQVKDLVKLSEEQRKANFNQKRFTDVAQLDAAESQSKALEMARMYIELQERMIENEYVKEKTILDIQQGNNDYALELISRQEEKINESYDKQITALEEINRLREKENELTSKRMSIAAALSSGDMASAASAMQDYREAKIAQNARTRMEALQKAKENAIKGVTSPGGKSRTELEKLNQDIEQRRIDIENEIREKKIELDKITQTKMKLTKDQIDSAISTINLAIEALGPEAAKSYLKNIFTVLDGNAETTRQTVIKLNKDLDTFLAMMDDAREKAGKNPLLSNIPTPTPFTPTPPATGTSTGGSTGTSTGGSTGTTPAPASEQILDSTGELLITPNKIVNGRIADSLPSVDETVDTLKKFNEKIMYDFIKAQGKTPPTTNPLGGINYGNYLKIPGYRGAMGGMVPKYMASGGLARGTDTVPAMLTPGEFVINKNATQKFGPLLSAINSPTFTTPEAMSSIKNLSGSQTEVNNSKTLYNYNLSVNVSNSNANPNDIARTVINQIKQIDNQRIRSL